MSSFWRRLLDIRPSGKIVTQVLEGNKNRGHIYYVTLGHYSMSLLSLILVTILLGVALALMRDGY